jgi:hypothetical protein
VYGLVCAALPVLRNKEGRAGIGAALFRAPAGIFLAWLSVAVSVVLATRMTMREGITLAVTVGLASLHFLTLPRNTKAQRDVA